LIIIVKARLVIIVDNHCSESIVKGVNSRVIKLIKVITVI